MKLLVTASRQLTDADYPKVKKVLDCLHYHLSEIWTGGAKGGDQLVRRYAQEHEIAYYEILPNYPKHGRNWAPLERNLRLIEATNCTLGLCKLKLTGGTAYTVNKSVARGHWTTAYDLETDRVQNWHMPTLEEA